MIATSLNKISRYAQWADYYVDRMVDGDYATIVLAYTPEGFVFDFNAADALEGKPIVVLDLQEYGWNTSYKNDVLWGRNMAVDQALYPYADWLPLHQWLFENDDHIICYFKRELTPEVASLDTKFPVHPVDLISPNRPNYPVVEKHEFLARPFDLMHIWGHSHEDRVELDKRINASELPGINASRNIHFSNRESLRSILDFQQSYKLSASLPGCGVKTFRHSESCSGCVPIVADVGMSYSVPWTLDNAAILPTVDGRINFDVAIPYLKKLIQNPELIWNKYEAAQESARQLDINYYVENHVNKYITSYL